MGEICICQDYAISVISHQPGYNIHQSSLIFVFMDAACLLKFSRLGSDRGLRAILLGPYVPRKSIRSELVGTRPRAFGLLHDCETNC